MRRAKAAWERKAVENVDESNLWRKVKEAMGSARAQAPTPPLQAGTDANGNATYAMSAAAKLELLRPILLPQVCPAGSASQSSIYCMSRSKVAGARLAGTARRGGQISTLRRMPVFGLGQRRCTFCCPAAPLAGSPSSPPPVARRLAPSQPPPAVLARRRWRCVAEAEKAGLFGSEGILSDRSRRRQQRSSNQSLRADWRTSRSGTSSSHPSTSAVGKAGRSPVSWRRLAMSWSASRSRRQSVPERTPTRSATDALCNGLGRKGLPARAVQWTRSFMTD